MERHVFTITSHVAPPTRLQCRGKNSTCNDVQHAIQAVKTNIEKGRKCWCVWQRRRASTSVEQGRGCMCESVCVCVCAYIGTVNDEHRACFPMGLHVLVLMCLATPLARGWSHRAWYIPKELLRTCGLKFDVICITICMVIWVVVAQAIICYDAPHAMLDTW